MKVAIIEDEKLAAGRLQRLLQTIEPNAEVVFVADTVRKATAYFESQPKIDLAFFDIELADGQSFDIFTNADVNCPVIFTTAYDEYALRAFKVNSIDYLLKPVSEDDLKRALEKFRRFTMRNNTSQDSMMKLIDDLRHQPTDSYRNRFLSKQGTRMISILVKDVSYIYSEDKVTFLMSSNGKRYIINSTLEETEQSVDPSLFFRVNRGMLVHVDAIQDVQSWLNGKIKLKVLPPFPEEVFVSRERAPDFRKWMGE